MRMLECKGSVDANNLNGGSSTEGTRVQRALVPKVPGSFTGVGTNNKTNVRVDELRYSSLLQK